MKLKNKISGEIKEFSLFDGNVLQGGATLESLTKEWEDYEEQEVFYIVEQRGIVSSRFRTGEEYEKKFKQIGNHFETEEEAEVIPNLMIGFGIDEIQAEFIAEIKLRNINKAYIIKRVAETSELEKEIKKNQELYYNNKPVISDMEFDRCIDGADITNFEYAKLSFARHGYKLPKASYFSSTK